MNIMIVEDDVGLSRGIPLALAKEGDHFFSCSTVKEARKILQSETIEFVILDIGLPDGDGLSFCREIRNQYEMPILFLTANDMEYDEVAGLDAGADDYMTKPFSLAVLRSRMEAIKRRFQKQTAREEKIGPYRFQFEEQKFYREEEEIFLSRAEQRLLRALVCNADQVMTRDILLDKVWGVDSAFLDENALSVTVGRLRSKLKDGKTGLRYLQTVYGVGYIWRSEPWTE